MSKLDELIAELCPDGVEYFELHEVFNIKNGYTPSKSKPEYWENCSVPWFRMEDIRANGRVLYDSIQHVTKEAVKAGYLFPENSIIISTTTTIGEFALIKQPFLTNQQMSVLSTKDELHCNINIKYVYHCMFFVGQWCEDNVNSSSIPIINSSRLARCKIPVPPLAVQKEIVRILDTFTELEAELEARKKQYEYYRDKLLTFKEVSHDAV